MAHGHGPDDDHTPDPANCALCRIAKRVNWVFAQLEPSSPNYRYWQLKRKGRSTRTFEYTTTKARGYGTDRRIMYWAVERRWIKVKGGEEGKIIRAAGFAQRKKAKARAYEWYTEARARTPDVA